MVGSCKPLPSKQEDPFRLVLHGTRPYSMDACRDVSRVPVASHVSAASLYSVFQRLPPLDVSPA